MQLSITSTSGSILSAERFDSVTIMTEAGEITILPGHEPLLSAIRPGILSVHYYVGGKVHSAEYATGGGVVNISPDACMIVADVIESGDGLTDLEYIESQKQEAEKMMQEYRAENGTIVDPRKLIDMEYELLKYSAMHRLGKKYREEAGARK